MPSVKYLDRIDNELFNNHSLSAFIVLINIGHELDFHYKETSYGVYWTKGNKKVILINTITEEKQDFEDATELVINGILDSKNFVDIWDEISLDQLL